MRFFLVKLQRCNLTDLKKRNWNERLGCYSVLLRRCFLRSFIRWSFFRILLPWPSFGFAHLLSPRILGPQPQEQFAKPTCLAQVRIKLDRTLNFSQDCQVQKVKRILQSTSRTSCLQYMYHSIFLGELSKSPQNISLMPFFSSLPKVWSTSASQFVEFGDVL